MAVVVAVALVLTSMTAAFAATSNPQADAIAALKLMQGNNGDMMLGDDLARDQAVKIIITLTGKAAEVEALKDADVDAALAGFADAAAAKASWSAKWYAYAIKNGIIEGYKNEDGDKVTDFAGKLYGKQFATMLMKAFGYKDVNYATSVTELSELEGSKVVDEKADDSLTRADAIAYLFGALTAKNADGKTVVETYVGSDADLLKAAQDAGLIALPAVFDVDKVSATNLRELVVSFTTKVPNADEAKKTTNYKIGSNNPEAVTLSEDQKTVTLRTSNANKMGNYATDVEVTIMKAVGFSANKTIKGIAVKDTTVPSALSVTTTGPRNIKVTMSEPLDESVWATISDVTSSFKIDGGLMAADPSSVTISGVELSMRTYSDMAEGDHKIEFLASSKLMDNAGYAVQAATLTYKYAKDTAALALSVVESNETSVKVKFNKALKSGSFAGNANVKITHTYSNSGTNLVYGDVAVSTSDDQTFTISFGDTKPFPPGATLVYIDYVSSSGAKIEDNYGNKLGAQSFTITTTADMTKPTVSSVEFVNATTIKVTFSEDVDVTPSGANSAVNTSNYTLKSGNDVIAVTGADVNEAGNNKVIKLTTATMNGGTYTLAVKKVQDTAVAKNVIDEATVTFTGTDKVPPTIKDKDTSAGATGIQVKQIGAKKVKIEFSEVMDAASITDKLVYKYNDANLADKDTVEAVDGNKAVIITIDAGVDDTKSLTVARVKDMAGNWIEAFSTTVDILPMSNVSLKSFEVVGKNAIKIVIDDLIYNVNTSDFVYTTGSGAAWLPAKGISSVSQDDGKTYITIVTEDITNTLPTGVEVATITSTGAVAGSVTSNAKNAYDMNLKFDSSALGIAVTDKYAPAKTAIAYTTQAALTTGTSLATVKISYSENLYVPSVQDSDYTVTGYEVTSVSVVDNVVTLTIKNVNNGSISAVIGSPATNTEIKVKQVGEVQDAARNTLGAQDEWSTRTAE